MNKKLIDRIKKHEGLRLTPYRDIYDNWTIGYGHLLFNPISMEAAEQILIDDIKQAEDDVKREISKDIWADLDETRFGVLVEMAFQLGIYGLKKFHRMLSALRNKNYTLAAKEILDSKYARVDCPKRAQELAILMEKGDESP